MSRLCAALTFTCLWLLGTSAQADIPVEPEPPIPKTTNGSKLSVTIDFQRELSQLVIPTTCLNREETDGTNSSISTPRTIIAGLAFSLAIGGMFFLMHSGKLGKSSSLIALVGVLSIGMAGYAWANGVPLPSRPKPTPKPAVPMSVGTFPVEVKMVSEGDTIQLILSATELEKLEPPEPGNSPPGSPRSEQPAAPKSAPPKP